MLETIEIFGKILYEIDREIKVKIIYTAIRPYEPNSRLHNAMRKALEIKEDDKVTIIPLP
ncbi:MAG: hypothetical protein LBB84_01920 [Tannerellaceae bacterium]|jgi:hypothetical protein|nr:hypothetical protein [Tannerellaceae bacterium]